MGSAGWQPWWVSGLLVAEVDGVVSGFSATSPAEERELGPSVCELNVFHVRPGQWGTGLATALMTATINWMHEAMDTQTELGKPLWRDLEIPQVRYVTDRIGSRP